MFRHSFAKMIVVVLVATMVPCALGGPPLDDPIPKKIKQSGEAIRLELVVSGLTAPNYGTALPGSRDRLLVTDQDGTLWVVDLESGQKSVFLDVSDRLVELGVEGPGTYDERGLLGVAVHPDYMANGLLYTYTSEPVEGKADFSTMPTGITADHQSVILEWEVENPTDLDEVVQPDSDRELLRIDQPQNNQNGGVLAFGMDETLFIGLGDGGGTEDTGVGHSPGGNAQDLGNVLGKILRIDPTGSNSANGRYGIRVDNPFVDVTGVVEEIYSYGMRNAYRLSWDMPTGRLYVGDVGENGIEEVDIPAAGTNCGWPHKEGSFFFHETSEQGPSHITNEDPGTVPGDVFDPIAQYDHDEGLAIVGGFVYRGSEIKSLQGRYVFGDFSQSLDNDGRLFYIKDKNPKMGKTSKIVEFKLVDRDELGLALLGFGQDAHGELYVLANATGTPFGDTGRIMRIAPKKSKP